MNIGSIVHEILQTALKNNLTTVKEIQKTANECLQREDIIQLLYACKMSLEELNREIAPFISRIHEFIRQYIIGDFGGCVNNNPNVKLFSGRISEIQDIEENIWCPRLGLKVS